jgi:hypothetical protein
MTPRDAEMFPQREEKLLRALKCLLPAWYNYIE